jgi:hypothetical protein
MKPDSRPRISERIRATVTIADDKAFESKWMRYVAT